MSGSGRSRAIRSPAAGMLDVALLVALAAGAASTAAGQDSVSRRPFDHRRHERVSCLECHGTGAEHRTIRVRTPRDCASCHHDARRERPCTACHVEGALAPPRRVTTSMSFSPATPARTRVLSFAHDLHLASGSLSCRDCHGTEVTLARNRECASCHASHHTAKADCTNCHVTPRRGVHGSGVHLSCAGSGCHTGDRAPSPTLSRNLCVVCHETRRDHEVGGVCAECHKIPANGAAMIDRGGRTRER